MAILLQGDMGGFGQAAPAPVPGVHPQVAAMQKEMQEQSCRAGSRERNELKSQILLKTAVSMVSQGDMGGFGQAPPAAVPGVNPKVAAMQNEMRERLARQEELEQKTKADLGSKAKTYLSSFYEVPSFT